MRIEVADQAGAHHDVRLRDRERAGKRVADANVGEAAAAALDGVHAGTEALRARSAASSARQSSVYAMPA